jgi:hypothetical protein
MALLQCCAGQACMQSSSAANPRNHCYPAAPGLARVAVLVVVVVVGVASLQCRAGSPCAARPPPPSALTVLRSPRARFWSPPSSWPAALWGGGKLTCSTAPHPDRPPHCFPAGPGPARVSILVVNVVVRSGRGASCFGTVFLTVAQRTRTVPREPASKGNRKETLPNPTRIGV